MNHCAKHQYSEQVLGKIALFGDWAKWRFAGRDLVSPDGYRISPERLANILKTEGLAQAVRIQQQKALPDNVLRPAFGSRPPSSAP